MKDGKDIYNMKLHEVIQMDDFNIVKVHGGWVYKFLEPHHQADLNGNWILNYIPTAVFVPLTGGEENNEK